MKQETPLLTEKTNFEVFIYDKTPGDEPELISLGSHTVNATATEIPLKIKSLAHEYKNKCTGSLEIIVQPNPQTIIKNNTITLLKTLRKKKQK
jgi:hypothetical protein